MGNSKRVLWKIVCTFWNSKRGFVTIDAGVIDSDYRGMINHNINKAFTICTNDRIVQVVFMERFDVNFEKVSDPELLGKTKRGNDGFGSTGIQVIKRAKEKCPFYFMIPKVLDDDEEKQEEKKIDGEWSNADQKTCKTLATVTEPNNDFQITSEQANMTVDNRIIVSKSITIE